MAQANGKTSALPPVTLADLMQALNATEANIRWWEADGTLPQADRDENGRLLWNITALQTWAQTDEGRKFIARRV